jgi:hypothetical protein
MMALSMPSAHLPADPAARPVARRVAVTSQPAVASVGAELGHYLDGTDLWSRGQSKVLLPPEVIS